MDPGGHLEGSWRPLGALEEAWSAKGRLPGAYGALLDASWGALGRLRDLKKFSDRLLAGPRTGFALPEGQMSAQKGWVLKLAPKADQAEDEVTIR